MYYSHFKFFFTLIFLLSSLQALASYIELSDTELSDSDFDESNSVHKLGTERSIPFTSRLLDKRNPDTNDITGIDSYGVFYSIARIDDGVSHLVHYKDDGTPYTIEDFFSENNKK